MSEYIVTCDEEVASWVGNDVESMKPLVRCRDCRFAEHNKFGFEPMELFSYTCTFWELEIALGVEPDGFCKWGERKAVSE